MRIIFAETPEFAAEALQALLATEHTLVAVYTQPDRPAGRGRQLKPSPVKEVALQHGIPVEQPVSLKTPEAQATLADYQPDLMVVAAYGLILPKAVLETPSYGCLNIHASLLPRWRGAAPIQRAILAGDIQTGITIMQMDVGLDTGAMLMKKSLMITPSMNAGELHDQLARLGAQAIVEAVDLLVQGKLTAEPQDNALATYASKLAKEESWINWSDAAEQIDRQVRAFNPWPVAQSKISEQICRIWQAEPLQQSSQAAPGTLLQSDKHGLVVACGHHCLRILRGQLPGGKPLSAAELLNGRAELFAVGQQFQQ